MRSPVRRYYAQPLSSLVVPSPWYCEVPRSVKDPRGHQQFWDAAANLLTAHGRARAQ